MRQPPIIFVDYWAIRDGPSDLLLPEGMKEFQDALSQSYISRIHGRPGGLGGGLYELAINVISNFSIHDIIKLICDGIAFDLLKSGTKSLVLRPLLAAYEKIKSKNAKLEIDISELKITFSDAEVLISKIDNNSVYENLHQILVALAENENHLKGKNGEFPYLIQIPVFLDTEQQLCRFRVLGRIEEPIINVTSSNYYEYWGLRYDYDSIPKVFDLKQRMLIASDYLSLEQYWQAEERNEARQKIVSLIEHEKRPNSDSSEPEKKTKPNPG